MKDPKTFNLSCKTFTKEQVDNSATIPWVTETV